MIFLSDLGFDKDEIKNFKDNTADVMLETL